MTLIMVQAELIRMANRPGVLRTIKGNIGAIRGIAADWSFRRRGADRKKMLRVPPAEKDLTFYAKPFTLTAPGTLSSPGRIPL